VLSATLLATIKECQDSAAASLLPLIAGFSGAGFAVIGDVLRLVQFDDEK
jgi:hypothetical protein